MNTSRRHWSLASPVFPVPHFRELGLESLKVPGLGLQLCGLQVWCWLVSTVLWFVVVEQQLDLSSMTAERWFLCHVVWVGYWRHESVVCSRVVASFLSDSCFATGCGLCVEAGLCSMEVLCLVSGLSVRLVVEAFQLLGGLVVEIHFGVKRSSVYAKGELLWSSCGIFGLLVVRAVRGPREDGVRSVGVPTTRKSSHSSDSFSWELGPESLKVPGLGLQLCGLQVWCWLVSTVLWFMVVERQLDLSSVTARLRGGSCAVLSGLDTGIMNQ
ncbi:hypothetical protein Taro_049978 [Colocasia esculenta]|uniref:Uncharacterized protein n=1 Tax=Colocasia esculenta TaxID=4460 RepID=A0A843XCI6_COLES|nr:hypothetical protein [Colocasia esculenta]